MSNNNNNAQDAKKDWKIYISLFLYALLGLAIGYTIAKGYLYFYNKSNNGQPMKVIKGDSAANDTSSDSAVPGDRAAFAAKFSSNFEGKNEAELSVNNDTKLKVTQGTGNKTKYFYVADAKTGANLATIYMSYEGGRGYSAAQYLAEVISKFVPSVSAPTTVTTGETSWLYASSVGTEWHIAPARDGEWLTVIENKKSNHDALTSIYETLKVK